MSTHRSNDGFILLAVLMTTVFIMMIGVVSLQLITSNLRTAKSERYLINAQFAADAGIDDAIRHFNQDNTWAGTGGDTTLLDDPKFKTTYQTSVVSGSTDFQKFINVTAKTFVPASSSIPTYTRKYQVEMRGVGGSDYSVVSGVGGLIMKNSAKIVDGKVFVNGNLTMSNNSQIGLNLLGIPLIPVDVKVAHQSCPFPADATYPKVCNAGENGQPISMSGSSHIYGEVTANNQINGSNMSAPGLVSGTVSPSVLPVHDRDAQKAAISNNMTGAQAGCTLLGVKTWPANTKITGNVTISGVCIITIEGDVWITGNLNISNTGILIVKNGLSSPPQIMIDGTTGLTIRNAAGLNANLSNIGMRIITYASSAACSPDCATVTGTDLYNSRDDTTISIENSASGGQTEFYAKWSKVSVANAGNLGALVGQTVELSNSSAITFGTSVSGFGGPVAWVVKSYKRTF